VTVNLLKSVNNEAVNLTAEETHAYQQKVKEKHILESKPGHKSKIHKWMDMTDHNICRFLQLIILMGIICKPTMETYWSTHKMLAKPFSENACHKIVFPQLLDSSISLVMKRMIK
jgi:hypothetical protein